MNVTLAQRRPAPASSPDAPPPRYAVAPQESGAALRVGELAAILRRNALPIALTALLGAAAAYAYALTLPRSYTAAAAVAVEGDRLAIPELQGALRADNAPDPMPFVRTEVQALGARQLVVRLIGELHLDRDSEFNPALRPPSALGRATAWVKALLPHRPAPAASGAGPDDTIVNAVYHALSVGHDNRSLVITVAFTAHSPDLAATAVNRLVADYIEERNARRRDADRSANTAISGRIDQVRAEIERIENDMKTLRSQSGVISLRAGSLGQQQVEELASELNKTAAQRIELQAQLARAQAAAASGSTEELSAVLGSETVSRLRQAETEAASRAAALAARFGPNYPPLISARADLASTRAQLSGEAHRIVASLSSQLAVATAHEADVKRQLEQARKEGAAAQDVQARLQQMQQDVATRRALYATLLEREQQTLAQPRGDQLPDVRVLSGAGVPTLPSAPNTKLSAALGGGAGALLAGLIAFTRATGRRRFASAAELESATGLRVLTALPLAGRAALRRLPETVARAPAGPEAQALRAAAARLPANARRGGQVVAFTAPNAERASLLAAAFARAVAQEGKPCLLLGLPGGADVAGTLAVPQGHLARILAGETEWHQDLARDPLTPLELLLAAETDAAPPADQRVAIENLLAELRQDFALIVMLAGRAPDALRAADTIVLVLDREAETTDAIRDAMAAAAPLTRAPLAALVLEAA